MPQKLTLRPVAGLTLAEILVAMALLLGAILALALLLPLSLQTTRQSGTRIVAHNLARQYVEWWRQQDFDIVQAQLGQSVMYVDPLPGPLPSAPSPQQNGSLVNPGAGAVYTSILSFVATGDPNLIRIDAVVDWKAGGPLGAGGGVQGQSQLWYSIEVFNATNPLQ